MRTYIRLPLDYEMRVQRLADLSWRSYHDQLVWIVCREVDRLCELLDTSATRERDQAQEADHAPAP